MSKQEKSGSSVVDTGTKLHRLMQFSGSKLVFDGFSKLGVILCNEMPQSEMRISDLYRFQYCYCVSYEQKHWVLKKNIFTEKLGYPDRNAKIIFNVLFQVL